MMYFECIWIRRLMMFCFRLTGDVPVFTAVEGNSVELPCNITPPIFTDRVRLVLYFRNDSAVPIYTWVYQIKARCCRIWSQNIFSSYDTRGQSHAEARHWSEEKILGGRAFFRGDLKPARLVIDNVKGTDAGDYRCRADFYRAPTTISHMRLDVIGITFVDTFKIWQVLYQNIWFQCHRKNRKSLMSAAKRFAWNWVLIELVTPWR